MSLKELRCFPEYNRIEPMKILILIYTLCNSPQYLTVVDGVNINVLPYTDASFKLIDENTKGRDYSFGKIPLDILEEGMCT